MDIETLKAEQESVGRRAQELINEQLRLQGEFRRLGAQIEELSKEDSGAPAPEAVAEDSDGPTPEASK